MAMRAVRELCEFPLRVSQQNHSDPFLTALDDALKRFYQKKGALREQNISKSGKTKLVELLTRESHQFWERKIDTIHAAIEVQVCAAEQVTTIKPTVIL